MPAGPPSPKDLGTYVALAQIGMEMVAPIGLGIALDYWLHWTPWAAVAGAVLGFVGGMAHLLALLNRSKNTGTSESRRDTP